MDVTQYLSVILIYVSSMTSLGIIYFLIICLCSLEKCLFIPHARYLNCTLCLFTFMVVFFFFFHGGILWSTKLLNFDEFQFNFFFFFLLVSHLRNHGIVYGNENVFMFYSKSFNSYMKIWFMYMISYTCMVWGRDSKAFFFR